MILGVALLCGLLLAGRWFIEADPKAIVRLFKWLLVGLILAVAIFFLVSGRFAWALATLPVFIPRLLRVIAAARMARDFSRRARGNSGGREKSSFRPDRSGPMSREEALEVLGLDDGASREEIKKAYRRLMDGLHPDHGGSDYLAAKINQARDILLGGRG